MIALLPALVMLSADPQLPGGLDRVPANAWGFLHVKVGEAWNGSAFRLYREAISELDPKYIEALKNRVPYDPFTHEHVTVFLLPPEKDGGEPGMVIVATMSKPLDPERFARALPRAEKRTINGKLVLADAENDFALHIADPKTLIVGPVKGLAEYFRTPLKAATGPLLELLVEAGKHAFVVGINRAAIPAQQRDAVPPAYRPLIEARTALAWIETTSGLGVRAEMRYVDAAAAERAEKAARAGLKKLGAMLNSGKAEFEQKLRAPIPENDPVLRWEDFGSATGAVLALGFFAQGEAMLHEITPKRTDSTLSARLTMPPGNPGAMMVIAVAAITTLGRQANSTFEAVGERINEAPAPKKD